MTDPIAPSLLWTDIETGGRDPLHPARGYLLEVGFRITNADLETLTEASWVIPYTPEAIDSIRESTPTEPVDVRAMHTISGLWMDCIDPDGHRDIEAILYRLSDVNGRTIGTDMIDWLNTNGAPGLPLAGSSVHFDRRWLTRWLPGFEAVPSHRNVDVSTLKELLIRWRPEIVKSAPRPAKAHRVLSDLDDSIAELRHYRTALGLDAVTSLTV